MRALVVALAGLLVLGAGYLVLENHTLHARLDRLEGRLTALERRRWSEQELDLEPAVERILEPLLEADLDTDTGLESGLKSAQELSEVGVTTGDREEESGLRRVRRAVRGVRRRKTSDSCSCPPGEFSRTSRNGIFTRGEL